MSSQQRSEVWRGVRKTTSGGLTKEMLTKNKRGKIVSKKKSEQAGAQNNLGSWLREKGKKIEKADMLRKKSAPPPDVPQKSKGEKAAPKKAAPKKQAAPKKAAPKAAPKAKPAPKAAPKPAVAQPKKKPKIVRKKAEAKPKRKKLKSKAGINPITQQPYDKKSKSGYVEKGAISLDNVKRTKIRPKKASLENVDWGAW